MNIRKYYEEKGEKQPLIEAKSLYFSVRKICEKTGFSIKYPTMVAMPENINNRKIMYIIQSFL